MTLKAKDKRIDTVEIHHLFSADEHYADTITIEVDRMYGELDLGECLFIMKGVNAKTQQYEQVLDKKVEDKKIILTWGVSKGFTAVPGLLELELRGVSQIGDEEILVIKFAMNPVTVAGLKEGKGGPTINYINDAVNNFFMNMSDVPFFKIMTQAQYDSLQSTAPSILYVIVG
ncbi:MAG: hypothetical protein LBR54_04840 [Oscillospiraceae bacterium]|nr:hypothetical protein [Oscillospiraceae bacterium]